jgi:hypothetical protein
LYNGAAFARQPVVQLLAYIYRDVGNAEESRDYTVYNLGMVFLYNAELHKLRYMMRRGRSRYAELIGERFCRHRLAAEAHSAQQLLALRAHKYAQFFFC